MTVQAEILDLLRLARDEFGASVLIITHNMGVIADIADEVVVMYRGHVVEQGSVEQIFYSPKDDYTKRLLAAVPRIGQKLVVRDEQGKVIERSKDWHDQPIAVEAKGLTITYPGHLTAAISRRSMVLISLFTVPKCWIGRRIRFRQIHYRSCHRGFAESVRRLPERVGCGNERCQGTSIQTQAC